MWSTLQKRQVFIPIYVAAWAACMGSHNCYLTQCRPLGHYITRHLYYELWLLVCCWLGNKSATCLARDLRLLIPTTPLNSSLLQDVYSYICIYWGSGMAKIGKMARYSIDTLHCISILEQSSETLLIQDRQTIVCNIN